MPKKDGQCALEYGKLLVRRGNANRSRDVENFVFANLVMVKDLGYCSRMVSDAPP